MVMLDGFRPDYLTLYRPPHLHRLMSEGTWVAEARSVFPSTTTTNQTSFVTGSLPATTGIPNNGRYDRSADCIRRKLRDNRCPTIAEILKEHGWTTASVRHFMLDGRGADRYISGDMDALIHLFESDPPGLAVYYNPNTDSVGHSFGPFSAEAREAVLAADDDIGRLLDALHRKGISDDTVLLVASDHGMALNDGKPIQPDLPQVFAQLGLKVALEDAQIEPDTDLIHLRFGGAFLYWREARRDPRREAQLLQALEKIEGLDVFQPDQMRSLGADPDLLGDLVLFAKEGWSLSKKSGTGGFHGPPYAGHSTMLFWGRGIRKGHITHRAKIIDVVPTLLALVGIEPPKTIDGQVLTDVLETPDAGEVSQSVHPSALGEVAAGYVTDVADVSVATDGTSITGGEKVSDASMAVVAQRENGVTSFTLDCGARLRIKSIGIVSHSGPVPIGPREFTLEIGDHPEHLLEVASGVLPPLTHGASEWVKLEQPHLARIIRLKAPSGHDASTIRIAKLLVGSDGESLAP